MSDRVEYNEALNKIRSQILVSDSELKAFTLLDFNIDQDKIIPYILEAQRLRLEPMIGTPLYKKLQQNNLSYEYQTLINDYVSPTLVHWALASYLNVAAYQVAEGGVFKHFSTDSETVTPNEVRNLVAEEHAKGETYARRMVDFLDTYKASYPEWDENASEGVKATQEVGHLGGWVLNNRYGSLCGTITHNSDQFLVTFWWGYNNTETMGFDPETLANKENTKPNSVQLMPQNEYVWMVSTVDFTISQGGVTIPLGDINDPADPNSFTYVKGMQDGKYWIRSTIEEMYEDLTVITIK